MNKRGDSLYRKAFELAIEAYRFNISLSGPIPRQMLLRIRRATLMVKDLLGGVRNPNYSAGTISDKLTEAEAACREVLQILRKLQLSGMNEQRRLKLISSYQSLSRKIGKEKARLTDTRKGFLLPFASNQTGDSEPIPFTLQP